MFVSVILPEYRLAREAVYTTAFSRMITLLGGLMLPLSLVFMIESGLFSVDDSSRTSEGDDFDLSDP